MVGAWALVVVFYSVLAVAFYAAAADTTIIFVVMCT